VQLPKLRVLKFKNREVGEQRLRSKLPDTRRFQNWPTDSGSIEVVLRIRPKMTGIGLKRYYDPKR
jgi:hypothetical protein